MNTLQQLQRLFVKTGRKTVTPTDIKKRAYLPNSDQREVLSIAGVQPDREMHEFRVVGTNRVLSISYYGSERAGSGRVPEYRIGCELLDYVHEGDELLIATDGKSVFVHCISESDLKQGMEQQREDAVCAQIDEAHIRDLALKAAGKPKKLRRETDAFVRNPAVREYVRRRSDFKCEMPGCEYVPFKTSSGHRYIEVYHITPLSEGGEDTVANTAAVCPECHARLHYSNVKQGLADKLRG